MLLQTYSGWYLEKKVVITLDIHFFFWQQLLSVPLCFFAVSTLSPNCLCCLSLAAFPLQNLFFYFQNTRIFLGKLKLLPSFDLKHWIEGTADCVVHIQWVLFHRFVAKTSWWRCMTSPATDIVLLFGFFPSEQDSPSLFLNTYIHFQSSFCFSHHNDLFASRHWLRSPAYLLSPLSQFHSCSQWLSSHFLLPPCTLAQPRLNFWVV